MYNTSDRLIDELAILILADTVLLVKAFQLFTQVMIICFFWL